MTRSETGVDETIVGYGHDRSVVVPSGVGKGVTRGRETEEASDERVGSGTVRCLMMRAAKLGEVGPHDLETNCYLRILRAGVGLVV